MKKSFLIQLLFIVILSLLAIPVLAGESPFSISLSGQYSPFISGDAGHGDDAPEYTDAFDDGIGFAVEAAYRINPHISFLGGVSFESASGDDYQDISFDDFDIFTMYVGGKYFFRTEQQGWRPYFRADIGTARFSDVQISYLGFKDDYWDGSWELMLDAGAGIEYKFNSLGIFAEVKARYLSSPKEASDMEEYSRANSSWTLPIILGISYQF